MSSRKKSDFSDGVEISVKDYNKLVAAAASARELKKALRLMIRRSDEIENAMSGATGEFEKELGNLSRSASAAEKVLKGK